MKEKENNKTTGLRFNAGKRRIELVPKEATNLIADVLTYGANKYTLRDEGGNITHDGTNNWQLGMPWMDVVASMQRHIDAFVAGQDYDPESGILHIGHAMTNLAFLAKFYSTHPEQDNRVKPMVFKIGLDIDDVICDFTAGFGEQFNLTQRPSSWSFHYGNHDIFKDLVKDPALLGELYSSLKPKINPSELFFEPHCYITSRSVEQELTEAWIEHNGFPSRPVYSVGFGQSKIDVAKKSGIDLFVDDSYDNYVELNAAGIPTFLWDAPHNQRYDVGFRRVKSMAELKDKLSGVI